MSKTHNLLRLCDIFFRAAATGLVKYASEDYDDIVRMHSSLLKQVDNSKAKDIADKIHTKMVKVLKKNPELKPKLKPIFKDTTEIEEDEDPAEDMLYNVYQSRLDKSRQYKKDYRKDPRTRKKYLDQKKEQGKRRWERINADPERREKELSRMRRNYRKRREQQLQAMNG